MNIVLLLLFIVNNILLFSNYVTANLNVLADGSITMEDYNREMRGYQNKELQFRSIFPVTVHHHAVRKLSSPPNRPMQILNTAPIRTPPPPPIMNYAPLRPQYSAPPARYHVQPPHPNHIAYRPARRRIQDLIQREPTVAGAGNYPSGNYSNPEERPEFPILMTENQINEDFDKTVSKKNTEVMEKIHRFPKMFPGPFPMHSNCEHGYCMGGCCEQPNIPIHATTLPGSPGPSRPLYLVLHPPSQVSGSSCPAPCQPLCLPQCNMRLQYSISQPSVQFPTEMQCRPECMPSCLVECMVSIPSIIRCTRLPCRCNYGYEQCSPFTCCSSMQMPYMRSNPKEKITIEDQNEPTNRPYDAASNLKKKAKKYRTELYTDARDTLLEVSTTDKPTVMEVTTTTLPTTTTTIPTTTVAITDYEPNSLEEDRTYENMEETEYKSEERICELT